MRANDIRNGMAIKMNGKVYVVIKYEHTKPGKGPAYIQAKLKDLEGSGITEKRFNSTETIESTPVDRRNMEFLYQDANGFIFMDTASYEQEELDADFIGDAKDYLISNLQVTLMMFEGRAISLDLPASVELEVTETPPGIKGATATNQLKEATLETGLKTRVPPFIAVGEKIKVSTVDGSYQSRA